MKLPTLGDRSRRLLAGAIRPPKEGKPEGFEQAGLAGLVGPCDHEPGGRLHSGVTSEAARAAGLSGLPVFPRGLFLALFVGPGGPLRPAVPAWYYLGVGCEREFVTARGRPGPGRRRRLCPGACWAITSVSVVTYSWLGHGLWPCRAVGNLFERPDGLLGWWVLPNRRWACRWKMRKEAEPQMVGNETATTGEA